MKVLERVDIDNWRHQCTCRKCDSKLEIEPSDLVGVYTPSGGDCRDGSSWDAYWTYGASCAVCKNSINIDEKSIPKALQIQVQERTQRRSTSYFDR